MRVVRADLTHSYHVHKTMIEYLRDVGQSPATLEKCYDLWLRRLLNPAHFTLMLMHGRKVIGMIWGQALEDEPKKTILIEGRFLRRAYRGKFKFTRELSRALKVTVKDFETVRMILPRSHVKMTKRYNVIGTLVEVSK